MNRRNNTWFYLWCEDGHRRSKLIGSLRDYPTKAAAWRIADGMRSTLVDQKVSNTVTVRALTARYEAERLPSRSGNCPRVPLMATEPHSAPLGKQVNN